MRKIQTLIAYLLAYKALAALLRELIKGTDPACATTGAAQANRVAAQAASRRRAKERVVAGFMRHDQVKEKSILNDELFQIYS